MVIGFVGLGNVGMNHHVKRISIADSNGNLDINGNVNINLSVKAYGVRSDVESKSVNVNPKMIGNKHDAKCEYSWLGNNKWLCQHNQKCKTERECQREWLCLNDWKSEEYTQELLKEYLKKPQNEQQYEFFRKDCKECGKRCQISSFHLYTSQEDESEGSNSPNLAPTPCSPLEPTSPPVEKLVEIQPQIPTVEIICHLTIGIRTFRGSGGDQPS
uniref:Uncharacterized protein n=1 Tax=Rhizophagus irregularis (strain DAOM 181602 / DAOM 197198 / MUCL 43194) TaxID=747089 RepID=U9UH84_RHIID